MVGGGKGGETRGIGEGRGKTHFTFQLKTTTSKKKDHVVKILHAPTSDSI